MNKKPFTFNIQNLKFNQSKKANYLPFSGTCLFANTPSQGIPSGGIDKPVAFPVEELQKALDTMQFMGVNCSFLDDDPFTAHDPQYKIGTVTDVVLKGNEMVISGGLWEDDFPEACSMFKSLKPDLGFSVEVVMNLQDMGTYYNARNIEFLGVCILLKDRAAFRKSYIAAQNKIVKDDIEMTKEELKVILDLFYKKVEDKIEAKFNELKEGKAQFSGNTQLSASEQFQRAIVGKN